MNSERLDTIKENEEEAKKGGVETDSDAEDEAVGDENDDGDYVDSDEEWKEQQKIFAKLGPKLHQGKKLTKEEMDEFGINDNDSDSDFEPDFEYLGGDAALYDSATDDVDELKYLRDTLSQINGGDMNLYQRIMSGIMDPTQKSKFEEIMCGVENLISKEADVTR